MPVVGVQILNMTPSDLKKQKPAHLGDEWVGAGAAVQTVPLSSSDWFGGPGGLTRLTRSAES